MEVCIPQVQEHAFLKDIRPGCGFWVKDSDGREHLCLRTFDVQIPDGLIVGVRMSDGTVFAETPQQYESEKYRPEYNIKVINNWI